MTISSKNTALIFLEHEYLEPILIRWFFRLVLPPQTSINSLFLKKKTPVSEIFVEAKIASHSLSAKTSDTSICFKLTFSVSTSCTKPW